MVQTKQMVTVPKKMDISIIIPMHNVEMYIQECLQSLLKQTYQNYEIICVDDGSEDHTVEIVKEYTDSDRRIHLYEHSHCGQAGTIRNFGMTKASGEYFLFLDGDDFFEPEMLEKVIGKMKEDNADVCVFGARKYIEKTKLYKKYDAINQEYIPEKLPFEGKTFPYIFNVCSATPWNKMFKRSLIERWKIEFMPLKRSNDVFFVRFAMAVAERVTILNEILVNYRQSSGSLQATNDKSPLDWYAALCQLKNKLKECGIYEDVKISFMNYCLSLGLYHLNILKTGKAFGQLYDKIKYDFFVEMGVFDYDISKFYSYNEKKCMQLKKVKIYTAEEYLFQEYLQWKEEKECWTDRKEKAQQEAKAIKESVAFKTGKRVLSIPRKMKDFLKKGDRSENI